MSILSNVPTVVVLLVGLGIAVHDFWEGIVALREGRSCRWPLLKAAGHVVIWVLERVL